MDINKEIKSIVKLDSFDDIVKSTMLFVVMLKKSKVSINDSVIKSYEQHVMSGPGVKKQNEEELRIHIRNLLRFNIQLLSNEREVKKPQVKEYEKTKNKTNVSSNVVSANELTDEEIREIERKLGLEKQEFPPPSEWLLEFEKLMGKES